MVVSLRVKFQYEDCYSNSLEKACIVRAQVQMTHSVSPLRGPFLHIPSGIVYQTCSTRFYAREVQNVVFRILCGRYGRPRGRVFAGSSGAKPDDNDRNSRIHHVNVCVFDVDRGLPCCRHDCVDGEKRKSPS